MSRLWQWWNTLPSELRYGIIATVVGGIILSATTRFGELLSKVGVGILKFIQRLLNRAMPPHPTAKLDEQKPQDEPRQLSQQPPPPPPENISPLPLIPKSPLVGFVARRDTEGRDMLRYLIDELAPEKKQLLALCGAGGLGKTTLAAESVRALSKDFSKRVAWVSADGRPDFTLSTLLDGVAEQLGHAELRPLTFEQKDEELCAIVAASPALVVLDNFETVSEAEQERCADWLANRADCSAIITSRNEVAYARPVNIFAMSMPEAREFIGRLIGQARHAQSFKGLEHDEIINAADRNPLVLQWIIKQIDQAKQPPTVLGELAQGKGDAAERVFGRSFNLLNDDGRAALLALSLFVPSASRPALAEVAGFGEDAPRLAAAAAQLAELWLANPTAGNERFTVEGLTRELAKNRLSSDARDAEFRQRFVAYFLRYGNAHGKTTPEDFDALEAEKDNILSAIDVAFALSSWITVMQLVDAINYDGINGMLAVRGYWDEAIKYNYRALDAARFAKYEQGNAIYPHRIGLLQRSRGLYPEARQAYEAALIIYRKLKSEYNISSALGSLAGLALAEGKLEEARQFYNESLEIAKRLDNQRVIAITLHELGRLAQAQGELEEARRLYDESLEIKRTSGDQRGIALTLGQLALLAQAEGDAEEARRLYDESLEISKRLGDLRVIATVLHQLAILAQEQGELEEAHRLYAESLEINKRLGNQSGIALTLGQLGVLATQEGDKAEGLRLLREALSIFERLKSPTAEIVRRNLAQLESESS